MSRYPGNINMYLMLSWNPCDPRVSKAVTYMSCITCKIWAGTQHIPHAEVEYMRGWGLFGLWMSCITQVHVWHVQGVDGRNAIWGWNPHPRSRAGGAVWFIDAAQAASSPPPGGDSILLTANRGDCRISGFWSKTVFDLNYLGILWNLFTCKRVWDIEHMQEMK